VAELKADVLVLGAGMVGVGAALHLQRRGRDVILVDRHELAGEETSFGNAGVIESAAVFPYIFPAQFRTDPALRAQQRAANASRTLRFAGRSALAGALLSRIVTLTGDLAGAVYW